MSTQATSVAVRARAGRHSFTSTTPPESEGVSRRAAKRVADMLWAYARQRQRPKELQVPLDNNLRIEASCTGGFMTVSLMEKNAGGNWKLIPGFGSGGEDTYKLGGMRKGWRDRFATSLAPHLKM